MLTKQLEGREAAAIGTTEEAAQQVDRQNRVRQAQGIRAKIAEYFKVRGLPDAAAAMEADLQIQGTRALVKIIDDLSSAIRETGVTGPYNHFAWDRHNEARRILVLRNEETAADHFCRLQSLVARGLAALNEAEGSADAFKAKMKRRAQQFLDQAKGIIFTRFTLPAIERLIGKTGNPVAEAINEDIVLGEIVFDAPNGNKARALIDGVIKHLEDEIASVHVGPMRQGKTERDRASHDGMETERRKRQLERAEACKSMKGHNSGGGKPK